jgi:primosomal protein N' (replication factor Y)
MIHSGMSKKRIEEEWQRARDANHPIIYVSTPGFSMIPRDDISVIIIEQEASRMYFAGWSPKIDWRMAIEKYGSLIGARVVLGDTLLRIETLARRDKGLISDISQAVFRVEKAPQTIVVNMNDKEHKIKDGFKLISEELWSMIDYAKKKNERMVIFCSRRGLSPQTLCGDCGKTVMCTRCSSPVVLHQPKSGDRFFLCHHCGEKRSALEACKNCGGWKLTTLGIGIDAIGTMVEKKYPDSKFYSIDPFIEDGRRDTGVRPNSPWPPLCKRGGTMNFSIPRFTIHTSFERWICQNQRCFFSKACIGFTQCIHIRQLRIFNAMQN